MEEEWRVIDEYPNYSVSDQGRVMNNRNGRMLTPSRVEGFLVVPLRKNNRPHNHYVHRIVAATFFDAMIDGFQVKHVNGDKENCSADNLRVTMLKSVKQGKRGSRVRILETGQEFETVKECADAINGVPTGIYRVLNQRSYTYHGYHFRYVE